MHTGSPLLVVIVITGGHFARGEMYLQGTKGEHFSTYGTSGLIPFAGGAPKAGDGSWGSVDGFIPAYLSQLNSVLPLDHQVTLVFGPDSVPPASTFPAASRLPAQKRVVISVAPASF